MKVSKHFSLRQILKGLSRQLFVVVACLGATITASLQSVEAQEIKIGGRTIKLGGAPKIVPPQVNVPKTIGRFNVDDLNRLGKSSRELAQRALKNSRESYQRLGKDARESLQRESKRLRQDTQRESVRLRKSLGWEWNDKVRDPIVADWNHLFKQGDKGLLQAQRAVDDGRTQLPQYLANGATNYFDAPLGRKVPGPFGEVRIQAGGAPAFDGLLIYEPYYKWGWNLRLSARFIVHSGAARLVVRRYDGVIVQATHWQTGDARPALNVRLATVPHGNWFVIGRYSSPYVVAIELQPGSEVTPLVVGYQR